MPASKRSTSLDPIAFRDFSAGISDLPGVAYQTGTATRANTYRCIANRSGALVPLPRRTMPFTLPHDSPSPTTQIAVVGIHVPPMGVLPNSAALLNPDTFPEHHLFYGTERLEGGNRYHKLVRVRRFQGTGDGVDVVKNLAYADTDTQFRPSGMGFATVRSNRADPTKPGCPVTIAMWVTGPTEMYLTEFPDDQNMSSATPYDIFTDQFLLGFACHQGRTVVQLATAYPQGPNATTFMGENLKWSRVNDVTTANWGLLTDAGVNPDPQVFVPENPSGFAFLAPMSANELFAVKGGHGGMYATGDLDNPTVVSLPMVTGAEVQQIPATNNVGVVYGNRTSGIWAWSHGDTSTQLSPQMEPEFWALTPGDDLDAYGGISYYLASCDEWILTPNNFVYDTLAKSWWRLEDPDVCRYRFMACNWHFIYAAESFYTSAYDTPIHLYRREDKASTYSWQSQPIWQSIADIVNVDTVELIAEGQGTVTLTLTALNGETRAITVTLADCGFPERFREAFAVQGTYLQLRVETDSGNSTVAAPTVYSVTLYPFTEQPVGHTL